MRQAKVRGRRAGWVAAGALPVAACVAVAVWLAAARGAAPAPKEVVVFSQANFEKGLAGWERQGKADFALDTEHLHDGHASARIAVAPGTKLEYQQIHHEVSKDVLPGDDFRATCFVLSEGVKTDPGAYMALEFLGADGGRVGIDHSRTSAANGSRGWEPLVAEGRAPQGTTMVRISLILHAVGTAWFAEPEIVRTGRSPQWPDLGDATREVRVDTSQVVLARFGGVGFHCFQQSFHYPPGVMDQIIYKRWRELDPSFARVNHQSSWDRKMLDYVAEHLERMKETGTEIYMTTWDPAVTKPGAERKAYAEKVAGELAYLVKDKGITNLHYYCMTNELSLGGWGKLVNDLPTFKDYQQDLYDAFKARGLKIGLLATDASPIDYWWTIDWATKNMDDITAIYGGHHYINNFALTDETFYPWFLQKMTWGAGMARAKGKDFILGEFGCKQDGRTVDGVKLDRCVYFDTPQEPLVAIQLGEAAIAAMNGGVYAMGYWTFMDLPDNCFGPHYENKWGLFRCSGSDYSTRDLYYGYGLLTKFFRGPSTVYKVECNDPRLRVAAIRHHGSDAWSIAIVNRNKREVPLDLRIEGTPVAASFRKYVYDPTHVPQNRFGDLQPPQRTVAMRDGRLRDKVGPMALTVYTTAYDDVPPSAPAGLRVETAADGKPKLSWRANTEPDFCYYRIFRSTKAGFAPGPDTRIGSTIATDFTDETAKAGAKCQYAVVAVDESENPSKPARVGP